MLDSEIGTKIDQILEDRDFFGKYEPTYHPTKEEIETANRETYEKKYGLHLHYRYDRTHRRSDFCLNIKKINSS